MGPSQLLEWQNLIFVLPFGAALFLTILQTLGGTHFGHGAHVHVGHHHLGGHHAHTSHAKHISHVHNENPGLFARFLSLLGLGKIPFMIGLTCFCYTWGFSGILVNQFLSKILSNPVLYVVPSVVATFVVASTVTGTVARVLLKVMPKDETYAPSELDMIGEVAKAYTPIDAKGGFVTLLDDNSNRIELRCLTEGDAVIPQGGKVVILRYNEEKKRFVVAVLTPSIDGTSNPPQLN